MEKGGHDGYGHGKQYVRKSAAQENRKGNNTGGSVGNGADTGRSSYDASDGGADHAGDIRAFHGKEYAVNRRLRDTHIGHQRGLKRQVFGAADFGFQGYGQGLSGDGFVDSLKGGAAELF